MTPLEGLVNTLNFLKVVGYFEALKNVLQHKDKTLLQERRYVL